MLIFDCVYVESVDFENPDPFHSVLFELFNLSKESQLKECNIYALRVPVTKTLKNDWQRC